MSQRLFIIIFIIGILNYQIRAQDGILSDIKDIYPGEIEVQGFAIEYDQEIHIEAVGFGDRNRRYLMTSTWILNAQSREIVWEMTNANSEWINRVLKKFDDTIPLSEGEYEVYFSAFSPRFWQKDYEDFGEFFRNFFDGIFERDFDENDYEELMIFIHGDGQRFSAEAVEEFHESFKENAIVSMTSLWDGQYEKEGFTLQRPLEIQIYAIGEADRSGDYDFGWIIDQETRRKIWEMSYRDSYHAGGAEKNRMVNKVIALPAGDYIAYFITDDSHSYHKWNDKPPYDPMFWGLTVRVRDASIKKYVTKYDIFAKEKENTIVQLTRLRDDEDREEGFTLNRPMMIRIYAIGEGTRGEMVDYGWIINKKTREKIWKMDYLNTVHAGGAHKNRLFDEVLYFDKGSYIVYFVTDDSHSFWDWNSPQPHDPEHFGITISIADENIKAKDISKSDFDAIESHLVLAKLIRMGDREEAQKRFVLNKDTDIRVYALGEGDDEGMYDYGWIENENTGQVIWEMTYRMTDHAGGSEKNRVYDGILMLKEGKYRIHYVSDGSHSFGNWNDDPPREQSNWGITIYRLDED